MSGGCSVREIEQVQADAEAERARVEAAAPERRAEAHQIANEFEKTVGIIVEHVSWSATELEQRPECGARYLGG